MEVEESLPYFSEVSAVAAAISVLSAEVAEASEVSAEGVSAVAGPVEAGKTINTDNANTGQYHMFTPQSRRGERHGIFVYQILQAFGTMGGFFPEQHSPVGRSGTGLFIRLWEKRTQTSLQATTFKSFLYTSVRNLAFDRMEKKDPLRHATDLKSSDKAWEEYDTLEEEVLARVKNEIDKLPERSRQIMQCIYLQGLHYKETAAKLGISIATVNTLLVNALKKIRQAYPDITQNIILFLLLSDKKR